MGVADLYDSNTYVYVDFWDGEEESRPSVVKSGYYILIVPLFLFSLENCASQNSTIYMYR